MPKRSSHSASHRGAFLLALFTLVLFGAGEALVLSRTDRGRLTAARYLHLGDPAWVTRLVGRQIHQGLDLAGIPADSVRESVDSRGEAPRVRWRVGLKPGASVLQTNYVITETVEGAGATVLSGREHPGKNGETVVELVVGLPRRPTHRIVLVRPRAASAAESARPTRLALVLYGFGDEPTRAAEFFALPQPFAVAIVPGSARSDSVFDAARARQREVILHLPLEPLNYPQVDPGPGTILVNMRPAKIESMVRRYLEHAGVVSAAANHMGSLATQDMTAMTAIYRELKRYDLPFLHVAPAAGSVCKPLAASLGVAYEEADAVLDAEAKRNDPQALNQRWNDMLKLARRRGSAVVLVRASPLVRRWLPAAVSAKRLEGVSIVPLSAILRKPTGV